MPILAPRPMHSPASRSTSVLAQSDDSHKASNQPASGLQNGQGAKSLGLAIPSLPQAFTPGWSEDFAESHPVDPLFSETVPSPVCSITSVASSLFTDLIKLSNDLYLAAELIKPLIDALGHDVVSFRRNRQVSYVLVDRARNICDQINQYIPSASREDWISYEEFTKAIEPVEE
jgi:hypothetical protein